MPLPVVLAVIGAWCIANLAIVIMASVSLTIGAGSIIASVVMHNSNRATRYIRKWVYATFDPELLEQESADQARWGNILKALHHFRFKGRMILTPTVLPRPDGTNNATHVIGIGLVLSDRSGRLGRCKCVVHFYTGNTVRIFCRNTEDLIHWLHLLSGNVLLEAYTYKARNDPTVYQQPGSPNPNVFFVECEQIYRPQ